MKSLTLTTMALAIVAAAALVLPEGSVAEAAGRRPRCTQRMVAGHWLFATDIGHFTPAASDITALGTMNVDARGNLEGTFDATFADPAIGFVRGATYRGRFVVNRDCTGTVEFVTSEGTARTDSIAIVAPDEFWGMSQLPENLWTYRARKIR